MAKKDQPTQPVEAQEPEIAYLELPDFKMPIAALPPEMQEMVEIYRQWTAEHAKAQEAVVEAEKAMILARRGAFLYEAGIKSLSDELIARSKNLKDALETQSQDLPPPAANDSGLS